MSVEQKELAIRNSVQVALIDTATPEGLDEDARMAWQIEHMFDIATAFDQWFRDQNHYRWIKEHVEQHHASTPEELQRILTRDELRKILDELGHPGASSSHAGTT